MWCRGIRGAVTIPSNNKESIIVATKELLSKMAQANEIKTDDIAAILFTTTQDLDAAFPAAATRELGWPEHLAMLCGHEINVPDSLPHCLRILMLVNTEKMADEINHIYLKEATKLRTPISPLTSNKQTGEDGGEK